MGNYCSSKQKDGGGGSDEYLQKARYKKHQKKADKSTNVFSVAKKGKNHTAVPTTTNNRAPSVSNNASGGSGVTFIIPKIEQPEETPSTTTTVKSFEPNNISSLGIHSNKTPENCSTYTLPDELKCVSTETKKLLLGVFEPTANQKTNKIVFYICVPDNKDFSNERRNFYEKVLPVVRSKCVQINYELHVIDLYRDCQQQKDFGHLDMVVWLSELRRQSQVGHVVPIVFVDDTLGPPVLPLAMARQDFDLARNKVPEASKLIEKWYSLDAQKNHYELRNEMMFETTFETQEADEKLWYDDKVQLQIALMKAFDSQSLRSGYIEQVFQQEVYNGIIVNTELAKKSVWILKNNNTDSENKCKNTAAESKKRIKQLSKQLKNELPESNIIFYEDSSADECIKKIELILASVIESVYREKEKQEPTYGVDTLLLDELRTQMWFGHNVTKRTVRKSEDIDRAKKYLTNVDVTNPMVLFGPPGSGKTTVMATIAKHCHKWNRDAVVIVRFADASANSSSLEQTLHSLTVQLNLVENGKSTWFKHDVQSYSEQIKHLLGLIGAKPRPVWLIIDGIDRFRNDDVNWIQQSLPNNVKMIVSVTQPSQHLNHLRETVKSVDSFIQISNMTDEQINSMLSTTVIKPIGSSGETIKNNIKTKTPLELQVSTLSLKIRNSKLPSLSENWLEAIFDNVESLLGKAKVSTAISYICATKYGLLDSEAIELLSLENDFCTTAGTYM